jgi:hypothetical protein
MANYLAKDHADALKDLDKLIELNPQYRAGSPYFYRGYCYHQLRDYGQSINNYTKAIELDPQDAMKYINRGAVYFDVQNYEAAQKDWFKAKTLKQTEESQKLLDANLAALAKVMPAPGMKESPKQEYRPKKVSWAEKQRRGGFDQSDWDRLLENKQIKELMDKWGSLGNNFSTMDKENYALMRETVGEMVEVASELKTLLEAEGEKPAALGNMLERTASCLKSFMEAVCLVGEEAKKLQDAPKTIETAKQFLAKLKDAREMLLAAEDYLAQAKGLPQGDEFLGQLYSDIEREVGKPISDTREKFEGVIKQGEGDIAQMESGEAQAPEAGKKEEPPEEERAPVSADKETEELQKSWKDNLEEADRAIGKGDFFSASVNISTAAEILDSLRNAGLGPEKIAAMQKISSVYELVNEVMKQVKEGALSKEDRLQAKELLSQANADVQAAAQEELCRDFSSRLKDRLKQAEKSLEGSRTLKRSSSEPREEKPAPDEAPRKRRSIWERMERKKDR